MNSLRPFARRNDRLRLLRALRRNLHPNPTGIRGKPPDRKRVELRINLGFDPRRIQSRANKLRFRGIESFEHCF
jgi:hypothetical protein